MENGFLRSIISIVTGLLISTAPHVKGDTDIYWTFDGFNPSGVVISPGDTVNWWNVDPYGFDMWLTLQGYGTILVENHTGVYATFSSPGLYNFSSDYGDSGSVVVNIPPVVTITNPVESAVFSAPATFAIQAEATETPDDTVWDVEFLLGSSSGTNSITDDLEAPFSASVTNLGAGTYTLIAIATDYYYATATNAITLTVVNPTPIRLSAPRLSANQFLFDVTGLMIGKTNLLQTSSDLKTWTPVKTNVATSVSATVTNTVIAGPRSYRVVQWF
jgi:hypothetical protein